MCFVMLVSRSRFEMISGSEFGIPGLENQALGMRVFFCQKQFPAYVGILLISISFYPLFNCFEINFMTFGTLETGFMFDDF